MHQRGFAWTITILGLVVASAAFSGTAVAQGDDERARLHFESGRSYFEEGAYERAVVEFERAYALSPRTAMLFNLAATYERLARYEDAARALEQYVEESPENLENRDVLVRRAENLRRRAAEIAAEQESGETTDRPPTEGGETTDAPTEGQQASATQQDVPPDSSGGGGDGLIIGGAVALGVAGAGLIVSGILGGMALGEQSSVESGCFTAGNCTENDISSLRTLATATDAMWITSAVIGAAGVVLLVLGVVSGGSGDSQASLRFTGNGIEGTF